MSDRFVSPKKPPEGIDRELLTILGEECAEVIQRASKALRFGITEVQPGQPDDNARRLGMELGDIIETAQRLEDLGVLRRQDIRDGAARKKAQLAKFLQTPGPDHG